MKKKKILYSELAPSAAAPVPAEPVAKKGAPVDLARALAAARAAEAIPAAAPVAVSAAQSVVAPRAVPAVVAPRAVLAVAAPVAPSAGRSLRDRVRGRTGQVEILLFRVADERFGIELAAVEEAIDIPPVHHVPEMPPAMLGVITVRGTLTSVYSPAEALGLALHDGTSALIFRRGRSRLAVVVDEVDDVTTLDLSLLRDAPVLDAGDGLVLGVVRQRDALIALVDSDALLAACQAATLLETA
jgi:chemotaxis signal transduction protein